MKQTLLTIVFQGNLSDEDVHEFSRNIAANLSERRGIASVRMQIFDGDRLDDQAAAELAEIESAR